MTAKSGTTSISAAPPLNPPAPMGLPRIFATWWPLAASWLLMGTELPAVSAAIARLPDPEINLAAYGGVVFALALIIEAPIIQLLAASTALSKDWDAYRKLFRYMMIAGSALTVVHILIAFTPLYDLVVIRLIGVPSQIVEPARIGLQIMTPWSWFIAYRRFHQGVLIRFNHSQIVGLGTGVRLGVNLSVLVAGSLLTSQTGIVIGTTAIIAGVISEALFIGIRVRPILQNELPETRPDVEPLTLKTTLDFYIPLALTSLLFLLAQPLGSAALSRMPNPIKSLAVWPVIWGLTFMVRSLGVAYNEVVVALLDEPGSAPSLRRFAEILAISSSCILLLLAVTPLSSWWFDEISGLSPDLVLLAETALWVVLIWPALNVYQSWYQGAIVFSRRTRGIPEAIVIFLVTAVLILYAGVNIGEITGLYIGLGAFVSGALTQTLWLWYRSQPARASAFIRDLPPSV